MRSVLLLEAEAESVRFLWFVRSWISDGTSAAASSGSSLGNGISGQKTGNKEHFFWWLLLISNASFQAAFKVTLPTWFSEMVMALLPVVIPLEVTAVDHQHSTAQGGQPMTWQGRYHCG